jgi:hypothetical protein
MRLVAALALFLGTAAIGAACVPAIAGPSPAATPPAAENRARARVLAAEIEQRVLVADQRMAVMAETDDLAEAIEAARTALDMLVGPRGRGADLETLDPGVLPGDSLALADSPGLAVQLLDLVPQDARARQAVEGALIGPAPDWRTPRDRWDDMDARLAEWPAVADPMAALAGRLPRVANWARLGLDVQSLADAHAIGARGHEETRAALQGARDLMAALSAE